MRAYVPQARLELLGPTLAEFVVLVPAHGGVQQSVCQQHIDQLPRLVQGYMPQHWHDGVRPRHERQHGLPQHLDGLGVDVVVEECEAGVVTSQLEFSRGQVCLALGGGDLAGLRQKCSEAEGVVFGGVQGGDAVVGLAALLGPLRQRFALAQLGVSPTLQLAVYALRLVGFCCGLVRLIQRLLDLDAGEVAQHGTGVYERVHHSAFLGLHSIRVALVPV